MNEDLTKKLPSDFESRVLATLESMSERMDSMSERLESTNERLARVETELGESRRQTRPLWDNFLIRLTSIEQNMKSINAHLAEFAREFFAMRARIAVVEDEVRQRPPAA
ncbi:MAG: hypothetical protein MSG64_06825 [Pyrinomonadaceae bacterium MAG19_C2-C3]|nr:hypothetical protein [Pyrinomonadaceae bacterium MAG19_C2-C3]